MKKLGWLLLILIIAPLLHAEEKKTVANRIGDMFSPGKLIKGHSHMETTKGCLGCHDINAGVNKQLCLDCHTEIKKQFDAKKGYHYLEREQSCLECHTDHKGREAKTYSLKGFEHEKLAFKTEGSHHFIDCEKCHLPKFQQAWIKDLKIDGKTKKLRSYLGLEKECTSCHGKPHEDQFKGQTCQDCHNEIAWKLTKFDHSKVKFKLEGKHKNVSCIGCHHKSAQHPEFIPFENLETQCSACHDDTHKGRNGKTCDSCHLPSNWKKMKDPASVKKFDHERTRFPLAQLHKKVKCETCHPGRKYLLGDKGTCEGCHKEVAGAMAGLWTTTEGKKAGPDPMFRTIGCDSCHETKHKKVTFKKVRKHCVECHNEAFGDLWDYRVKKYGTREKRPKNKKERALRLKRIHRFADFVTPEKK